MDIIKIDEIERAGDDHSDRPTLLPLASGGKAGLRSHGRGQLDGWRRRYLYS